MIRKVYEAAEERGIFVLDRGGDRKELYHVLVRDSRYRFIIRQRGDRQQLYRGKSRETVALAENCKTPSAETVIKEEDGKEKPYFVHFGFRPVRLPEYPERQLYLVVIKGFGQQPLMLLTTEPMRRCRKMPWLVVAAYITRRQVEETVRFIKQSYDLEDVRILTYRRLQNLVTFVLAASFFAAVRLRNQGQVANTSPSFPQSSQADLWHSQLSLL